MKKPDYLAENDRLRAEVESLKAAVQAEKQRFIDLRHRVRSELFANSIVLAAQRRNAQQHSHCALCVTRIGAAAALHQSLDDDTGEVCQLQSLLPALVKNFRSAFAGEVEFHLTVQAALEVDYRRAQSFGLFFAEAALSALRRRSDGQAASVVDILLREADDKLELRIDDLGDGANSILLEEQLARLQGIVDELKGEVSQEILRSGLRTRLFFPR